MSSSVRSPVELEYPSSDGTPMAASAAQGIPLRYPATGLRDYFRDRHDGYVSGNHAAMLTMNTVDDQSEQSSNSVTATVNGATRSWGTTEDPRRAGGAGKQIAIGRTEITIPTRWIPVVMGAATVRFPIVQRVMAMTRPNGPSRADLPAPSPPCRR